MLTTHSNALDCLLTVIAEIYNREAIEGSDPSASAADDLALPTVDEAKAVRRKKLLLTEGVQLFNEKPKKGIKYVECFDLFLCYFFHFLCSDLLCGCLWHHAPTLWLNALHISLNCG